MKELWLENVSDMDNGNAFLPEFMKHYNERFSLSAVKAEGLPALSRSMIDGTAPAGDYLVPTEHG